MTGLPLTASALACWTRWKAGGHNARVLAAGLSSPEVAALERFRTNLEAAGGFEDWWVHGAKVRPKPGLFGRLFDGLQLQERAVPTLLKIIRPDGWFHAHLEKAVQAYWCPLWGDRPPVAAPEPLELTVKEAVQMRVPSSAAAGAVSCGFLYGSVRDRLVEWLARHDRVGARLTPALQAQVAAALYIHPQSVANHWPHAPAPSPEPVSHVAAVDNVADNPEPKLATRPELAPPMVEEAAPDPELEELMVKFGPREQRISDWLKSRNLDPMENISEALKQECAQVIGSTPMSVSQALAGIRKAKRLEQAEEAILARRIPVGREAGQEVLREELAQVEAEIREKTARQEQAREQADHCAAILDDAIEKLDAGLGEDSLAAVPLILTGMRSTAVTQAEADQLRQDLANGTLAPLARATWHPLPQTNPPLGLGTRLDLPQALAALGVDLWQASVALGDADRRYDGLMKAAALLERAA